jgi:hypothetical protein
MKNLILLILTSLILCLSCHKSEKNEPVAISAVQATTKSTPLKVPSQLITIAEAVSLKEEFNNPTTSVLQSTEKAIGKKKQHTIFNYIDLQTLKDYVAFLEEVQRLNNKKISGVRIYYGAHKSFDSTKTNRETLFFVPTIPVASTPLSKKYPVLENIPFAIVPKGSNKFIGDFKPIAALLYKFDNGYTTIQKAASMKVAAVQETSLAIDKIGTCPPPKKEH